MSLISHGSQKVEFEVPLYVATLYLLSNPLSGNDVLNVTPKGGVIDGDLCGQKLYSKNVRLCTKQNLSPM